MLRRDGGVVQSIELYCSGWCIRPTKWQHIIRFIYFITDFTDIIILSPCCLLHKHYHKNTHCHWLNILRSSWQGARPSSFASAAWLVIVDDLQSQLAMLEERGWEINIYHLNCCSSAANLSLDKYGLLELVHNNL